MSTSSNDQGRAYEYAWLKVLYQTFQQHRRTRVVENSSLDANKRAWDTMTKDMQDVLLLSANSAVDAVMEMEPRLLENDRDELTLEFQQDGAGIKGDVRDIVIKRSGIDWEIGLSIKHNHEAVKHSRLSHKLDFGNEWYEVPCSDKYWEAVTPLFDWLKEEKKRGTKWPDIGSKEDRVYIPLLDAFMEEVQNAFSKDSSVARRMIEYLIGINDYYKVVSFDRKRLTMIHTFNIHGSLNKPSKTQVSAISVPVIMLPNELVAMKYKTGSKNTVEMYLNNGWQLSFRIHNASSRVEPSLKFDIQFISMPCTVLNIECKWK